MTPANFPPIAINEVAARDGLQNEDQFVETDDKVALIDALSACGFTRIEVTSFTSPRAIPALRDAEQVMQRITRDPNVIYTALVPNVRGAERALESKVDEFNVVMSVSETHNLTNLHMTRDQSFDQIVSVIDLANANDIPVNVALSCTFGCPMEGEVSPQTVAHWVDQFAALRISGITLCDTTGMADPGQIATVCRATTKQYPDLMVSGHFHNTRGMGLANVLAAIENGVYSIDSALGGIGGCPYAPGATGNVATEDVVHMLDCMGFQTGVRLESLLVNAGKLSELIGHAVPSQVSQAGPRTTRHPIPDDFEAIREKALRRS